MHHFWGCNIFLVHKSPSEWLEMCTVWAVAVLCCSIVITIWGVWIVKESENSIPMLLKIQYLCPQNPEYEGGKWLTYKHILITFCKRKISKSNEENWGEVEKNKNNASRNIIKGILSKRTLKSTWLTVRIFTLQHHHIWKSYL